jgi:hypothetical protein
MLQNGLFQYCLPHAPLRISVYLSIPIRVWFLRTYLFIHASSDHIHNAPFHNTQFNAFQSPLWIVGAARVPGARRLQKLAAGMLD